jgi:hypothetical protein
LPLTPAFLGRIGLYVSLWESGNWLLIVLASAATLLILTPVWNFGCALKGIESREPTRGEYAGLAIVSIAFAALAFAPMLIAHALAPNVGDAAERAMDRVIRTSDALGVAIGTVMLLLPVVGSYFLRYMSRGFRPQPSSPIVRTGHAMDLVWLEHVVTGIGYQMGVAARNVSTIAEENPTVWILFAALWLAIFITIAR